MDPFIMEKYSRGPENDLNFYDGVLPSKFEDPAK
jgi:hypothetical protein